MNRADAMRPEPIEWKRTGRSIWADPHARSYPPLVCGQGATRSPCTRRNRRMRPCCSCWALQSVSQFSKRRLRLTRTVAAELDTSRRRRKSCGASRLGSVRRLRQLPASPRRAHGRLRHGDFRPWPAGECPCRHSGGRMPIALVPDFLMNDTMPTALVSGYLPMNAMLRLGFSKLADPVWFNPLLVLAGGGALLDISRRAFGQTIVHAGSSARLSACPRRCWSMR